MDNNKFRQLCGKINYNTYNNIKNTLVLSGLGLSLTNYYFNIELVNQINKRTKCKALKL